MQIELGKRLREVTAYLDSDWEGGKDSRGRERNKWRETETLTKGQEKKGG